VPSEHAQPATPSTAARAPLRSTESKTVASELEGVEQRIALLSAQRARAGESRSVDLARRLGTVGLQARSAPSGFTFAGALVVGDKSIEALLDHALGELFDEDNRRKTDLDLDEHLRELDAEKTRLSRELDRLREQDEQAAQPPPTPAAPESP